MCYTSLISTWATVIFKQFLTMDHFPMLCRILKYVSFSGPFPWHSNKCAVHRLTTKVYTKPCISISTPRREPTRYWFANIVQWLWVVVGQPASQPHLKFSKKCSFHPEILLSRCWQTCWLNDLGSRFDPPYDPIRSDRIKFGYLITFRFHQQRQLVVFGQFYIFQIIHSE